MHAAATTRGGGVLPVIGRRTTDDAESRYQRQYLEFRFSHGLSRRLENFAATVGCFEMLQIEGQSIVAIALPSDFRRTKCSAAVRASGSQRDALDDAAVADWDGVFT